MKKKMTSPILTIVALILTAERELMSIALPLIPTNSRASQLR